jgi:hypothetical protein
MTNETVSGKGRHFLGFTTTGDTKRRTIGQATMADGATMQIDNQKNGMRGGTIHHDAIHTNHCPIQALACRVHHIMQHPNGSPDDIISTYYQKSLDFRLDSGST